MEKVRLALGLIWSIVSWSINFAKALFLDFYNLSFKFISRKILMSLVAIAAMVHACLHCKESALGDVALMVVLPTLVVCITVICVTYVTGQAKIDVQAKIEVPKA